MAAQSINVCDFMRELKRDIKAAGDDLSKYDAIGMLMGHCKKYHLRVRQELVPAAPDTHPSKMARRVIITADKFNSEYEHPVSFQCNGLVIDTDSWEIISMPAPVCRTTYNKKQLIEGIASDSYEIYRVRDGTITTLYWYETEQRWCMSSANGWQINTYKWMGDRTYEEAFNELAKLYTGFSMDALDKTKCYTLGFRHHDFHPYAADPQSIWFIQCCDLTALNTGTFAITTAAGGPLPDEVNMLERQIVVLVKSSDAANFMGSVITDCKRSVENVVYNHGQSPDINYGYIFRDPTSSSGQHSHIVIESALMQTLRRLLYNFNDVKRDNRIEVNNTNRLSFIIIRAYLNYISRTLFITLMPQFTIQYEHNQKVTNQIVNKIIYKMRNPSSKSHKTTEDDMVRSLTEHIMRGPRLDIHNPHTRSIIHDIVVDPKYTHMYYKLLVTDKQAQQD